MINDYAKFVDKCTSAESRETSAFQQRITALSVMHPEVDWSRLMTSAIGMLAESGEFTEIMKKIFFQGKEMNEGNRYHMKRELGDVLWYIAAIARDIGYELDTIAEMNLEKLADRKARGTIQGNGDNR